MKFEGKFIFVLKVEFHKAFWDYTFNNTTISSPVR